MNTFKSILTAWALLLLPAIFVTCDDDKEEITIPPENSIPGQEVGIRQLSLKVPRLGRLEVLFSRVNCRIHLKGIGDRVTYPINTFLSADADTLLVEAEDPILSELPHQQYYLNYITFPKKDLTVKAKTAESAIVQDTIYLGARLSIEDPNNIAFRSSFNKKDNCIGSGAAGDSISIACGADFLGLIGGYMATGDDLEGKHFTITDDINFQTSEITYDKGWEPLGHNDTGTGSVSFNGTLNGNGNRIEHLFCQTTEGYGGLFYSLGEKAYIHDIQFHYVSLEGSDNLGTIACFAKPGSRLENISVEGNIYGRMYVGGLVGNGSPSLTRCVSSVGISVQDQGGYVGGMIGKGDDATFTDCMYSGQINASTGSMIGGIAGFNRGGSFTRCYVSGRIEGKSIIGGLCGSGMDVKITDCQVGTTLSGSSTYKWQSFVEEGIKLSDKPLSIVGGSTLGGFIGSAEGFTMTGTKNAYKYANSAMPAMTGNNEIGSLVGVAQRANVPAGTEFISYAHIKGNKWIGGLIGHNANAGSRDMKGTFINRGAVSGTEKVGGMFGLCYELRDGSYENTGKIVGVSRVGGIAGEIEICEKATIINDGSVEATGDYVGGFFGMLNQYMDVKNDSRLSNGGGSMLVKGINHVGGLVGRFDNGNKSAGFIPPCYANIEGESNVGGLFGSIGFVDVQSNINLFSSVSPGRVAVSSAKGNHVGGAIGLLQVDSKKPDVYSVTVNGIKQLQGSIKAKGNGVGGIVGRAENYHCRSLHFINCDNHMDVTSESPSHVEAYAGIIGVRYEAGYEIKVTSCSNHGNIYGSPLSAAGGIAGQMKENIYIDQCYNTGTIDGTSAVGGIMGRVFDYSIVSNCFNMGSVPWASNKSLLAGLVGQKEDKSKKEILIENSYNIGETGWGIIGGENKADVRCVNCYYLNTASNGDMKGSGSQARTADEMRRKATFAAFPAGLWTYPSDGVAAPYLKNATKPNPLPLQK